MHNKFDATVKFLNSFLDSTRNDYKLGDEFSEKERTGIGKDAFVIGYTNFESKWNYDIDELNSIVNKLNKIADISVNIEVKEALDDLETNYQKMCEAFKNAILQLEKNENTLNEIQERGNGLFDEITDLLNVNFNTI